MNRLREIAVLPESVIDQIAAGEVVERPASVVKELVENSLDAEATDIAVEIVEGGLSRIAVHDNGVGMSREAASLALKRHATSKIRTTEDLATVGSLGFRGEALPSIASVSRLEVVTRTRDEGEGTRLSVSAGKVEQVESAPRAGGTSVEARDLFYNVPARRKFVKTAASESRRVLAVMTELALSRPAVGFVYRSEDREVFNVAGQATLLERTSALLGRALAESLLELKGELDYVRVSGFIGRPDQARAGRQRVFLFVNGRRIQDRSLFHALTSGYGRYLPEGKYPVAVINLDMPPEHLDVNVHPTKAEVRFLHPRLVYDALHYSVNRVLTGTGAMAVSAPGRGALVTAAEPAATSHLLESARQVLARRLGTPQTAETFWDEVYRPAEEAGTADPAPVPMSTALPTVPPPPAGQAPLERRTFIQFDSTYIVAEAGGVLFILDQHTAHERVLFEAVLRGLHADLTTTQSLLFGQPVELDAELFAVFEAQEELFLRVGFEARVFGTRTVIIEGTPAVMGGRSPERLFREVLETMAAELRSGRDRLSAMAASFACRAAVKSGDPLGEAEMASLFERLMQSAEPLTCPHGRPTVIQIPRSELDRKFGRT